MRYYAIIYVDKVIHFIENPDGPESVAYSVRDFLAPKLNLDINNIKIKEVSFSEYSNLMARDEKTNIEFEDDKIKKVRPEVQEKEIAEVVDWRFEPVLDDYWSEEEITDIMENRDHILINGLNDIPNTIPTKYKTVTKEVDVKVELYETDASDARLVEGIINEG